MNTPSRIMAAAATLAAFALAAPAAPTYPPGPDSEVQPGVPQGELIKYEFSRSKIFPGTTRSVTVYVPKQYDPAKPACVHVNQDGVQFNAPTVLDNLIAKAEIPVMIGVFVTPGVVTARNPDTELDRYNRSYEYDGVSDAYVRFLLDELLPDVEQRRTSDGRPIRLSHSGNDRSIGGTSSGAICAFTAAWERPDAFTRVFSGIGTYVGLRGGNNYPTLIRKYEPKPIRVFLQDGENDLNIYGGDWWMANQTMERALEFSGYDVKHVWGVLGHNNEHATALFPDAMRWLWRDWPQPVKGGPTQNPTLDAVLVPGENWELVADGYALNEGAATNTQGDFFFTDIPASKSFKLDADGKPVVFASDTHGANGQAFGPDGRLYTVASGSNQVVAYDATGKPTVIADGFSGNDLVVAHNGNIYATNPGTGANKVWLVRADGTKQVVVESGVRSPNGIALSPDQSLLYVADYASHWVYSYQVQADGTLADGQRYFWLHVPDTDDQAFADGMKVDREGRLYVATKLGIQVCDQPGRVNAIIPTPNGRITNLVFAGKEYDTLYVTCFDKVYRRKVKVHGANAWDVPNKPAKPHL
ncbi:MAG TPA: SMP-30/gluconolactonase/LRE family protein [Opitutus sp.]|nr:SMP-30/gluconolactonase/LRE family protein [Opitutus sp.]